MGFTEADHERLKENQRIANGLPLPPARLAKTPEMMAEKELEQKCTQMLIQDGWRPLKTNPVSRRGRGAGFGEKGMADYLYLRYGGAEDGEGFPLDAGGQILWIEWKRADNSAEPHQVDWHAQERARGAIVWVAGVDFECTPESFWQFYCAGGWRRE